MGKWTRVSQPLPILFASELLTHFIRGGDKVVSASSDLPLVSAYGAIRTNGTAALLLINKSPANYYDAGITLTNWPPAGVATVYSYGMPQDDAARNGNNACDITTNTCNVSTNFNYVLAPYSMNVFVFSPAGAAPSLSILHRQTLENSSCNFPASRTFLTYCNPHQTSTTGLLWQPTH